MKILEAKNITKMFPGVIALDSVDVAFEPGEIHAIIGENGAGKSIVGFISALAGLLYVCRLGSAQTAIGEDWPMNSIAASVIGGVALTGGVGNPAGALIGAAVITIIQNIIVLFGVNSYWQSAVSGIVVVLAISFSSISTIVRENRQKRIKLN